MLEQANWPSCRCESIPNPGSSALPQCAPSRRRDDSSNAVTVDWDARWASIEALLSRGGLISVQVLNELASVAHRKLRMSWPEVTEALGAIRILCPSPIPITAEVHDAALRLAGRHGFHIYDALIVAAALEADCATLYTEDLQSGQVIDGRLTIHNPFHVP